MEHGTIAVYPEIINGLIGEAGRRMAVSRHLQNSADDIPNLEMCVEEIQNY